MALILVPFMIVWNIYGNCMIQSDYFTANEGVHHSKHHNSTEAANTTAPYVVSNVTIIDEGNMTIIPLPVTDGGDDQEAGVNITFTKDEDDKFWHVVPIDRDEFGQIFAESEDKHVVKCNLNSWYQMLSILYMLLIYIQIVVFQIVQCTTLNYMKRFFLIVDEIPFEQQRKLPVSEGGRGHPLFRRSFFEYRSSFDYAYYIMSRGRINRQAEIRYLQ